MMRLERFTKSYQSNLGPQYIFRDVNFSIPDNYNIALLGRNGAGKSTLFRLIAGSEYPDKGRFRTDKAISWPVALATGIHPLMTGEENCKFIGRVNGVEDVNLYAKKVKKFSGLDNRFKLPVKSYSSGMRAKLAFACCISIDFDVYLIDEVTSVTDSKFKLKAREALLEKSKVANVIMVSHDLDEIREFCDSAIIINDGKLKFYQNLEEAIQIYDNL